MAKFGKWILVLRCPTSCMQHQKIKGIIWIIAKKNVEIVPKIIQHLWNSAGLFWLGRWKNRYLAPVWSRPFWRQSSQPWSGCRSGTPRRLAAMENLSSNHEKLWKMMENDRTSTENHGWFVHRNGKLWWKWGPFVDDLPTQDIGTSQKQFGASAHQRAHQSLDFGLMEGSFLSHSRLMAYPLVNHHGKRTPPAK